MSDPVTAIVLAGGQGTRLRSVVPDLPKPMAPIAGRPFLEYLLDYWITQGVSRIILSVGYRREAIMVHFGAQYRGVPVEYSIEEKPMGTGGGLLLATQHLNSNEKAFLLLNGDTYFAASLRELIEFANARAAAWTLTLFPTDETDRYMDLQTDSWGQVLNFRRNTSGKTPHANGGVYWVCAKHLAQLGFTSSQECSLETDILPKAMATGQKVFGLPSSGVFIDIGVPKDYQRAHTLLPRTSQVKKPN
ncbi:MAG TPA: nucleotidyltransferase family protein [Burkholderiaceae bacterium]|nr:nucleotidyltransferase family protein [Burkholderiaceae bacterium]